jgi:hypothetical protein
MPSLQDLADVLRDAYGTWGYPIILVGALLENTALLGLLLPGGALVRWGRAWKMWWIGPLSRTLMTDGRAAPIVLAPGPGLTGGLDARGGRCRRRGGGRSHEGYQGVGLGRDWSRCAWCVG